MTSPLRAVLLSGVAAVAPLQGHAQDTLQVWIENKYTVVLQVAIGNALRTGADTVDGRLVRQADGTWQGTVTARQGFNQTMNAFGIQVCPPTRYTGSQRLTLSGTTVGNFNPKLQSITLTTGAPDGGFLSLSVRTVAVASMTSSTNSVQCLTLREDVAGNHPLLPLSDARWTEPSTKYIIGLPQSGRLEYNDLTVLMGLSGPLAPIQGPVTSSSNWTVRIERW